MLKFSRLLRGLVAMLRIDPAEVSLDDLSRDPRFECLPSILWPFQWVLFCLVDDPSAESVIWHDILYRTVYFAIHASWAALLINLVAYQILPDHFLDAFLLIDLSSGEFLKDFRRLFVWNYFNAQLAGLAVYLVLRRHCREILSMGKDCLLLHLPS